MIGKYKLS